MSDQAQRERSIGALFAALRFALEPEELAAMVWATEAIPLPWLDAACRDLAQSWDDPKATPKPGQIGRAAMRLAGFRPRRSPAGYTELDPRRCRWWPPIGMRASLRLAEQWAEAPPPGALLPGGVSTQLLGEGR